MWEAGDLISDCALSLVDHKGIQRLNLGCSTYYTPTQRKKLLCMQALELCFLCYKSLFHSLMGFKACTFFCLVTMMPLSTHSHTMHQAHLDLLLWSALLTSWTVLPLSQLHLSWSNECTLLNVIKRHFYDHLVHNLKSVYLYSLPFNW